MNKTKLTDADITEGTILKCINHDGSITYHKIHDIEGDKFLLDMSEDLINWKEKGFYWTLKIINGASQLYVTVYKKNIKQNINRIDKIIY